MTIRDGHIGMNFPIKTDFLYITTDPDVNTIELPLKIIKTIKEQEQNQIQNPKKIEAEKNESI